LQRAQGKPEWWPLYAGYAAAGFCVISSYWTALTLGWIAWRTNHGLQAEFRAQFRELCWLSLVVMALPALGIVWLGGWVALGLAATALLAPIVGYAPVLLRPKTLPPLYARAIARMKFGKYTEAEAEVIRQLEKREDDFEGWMMLADLYANHFGNLDEAEQTILEICDQPRTNASQVSVALHRLADWHLKLRGDPDAARRALEVIVSRQPGSHLARMAQARAAQLPRTAEEWREQHENKPMHLPAIHDPRDEVPPVPASHFAAKAAADRAAKLAARLKTQPGDQATREELARLLGGSLNQPHAAIVHVQALLDQPDAPPEKAADWLGLIAMWQLEQLHDLEAGRETLRRVIREHPRSPTAQAAQRRLQLLETDERLRAAQAVKPPPIRIRVDLGEKTGGG
jgi:tetratricopeptide (TPR) repeat protein